jgi:uncharacterized protein
MLRGVAEAARAWDRPALRDLAVRNAEFLASALVEPATGRVMRVHMEGVTRVPGFLEDHAAVALGFLAVWGLTFERRWLDLARRIGDAVVERFWDADVRAFFDTASDAERLVSRPRDPTDNATPSGTSLAVELLLALAHLTGDAELPRGADIVLESLAEPMARHAPAFGHLLGAADMAVDGAVELVLVGDPGVRRVRGARPGGGGALRAVAARRRRPPGGDGGDRDPRRPPAGRRSCDGLRVPILHVRASDDGRRHARPTARRGRPPPPIVPVARSSGTGHGPGGYPRAML